MFTGLIEATGSVVSLMPTSGAARLVLSAPALSGRWRSGDSIAVNGVCLTAIPLADRNHFAADLATETIARTTLASLTAGTIVNLELPTPAGAPLGGHIVQGHVDATGHVERLEPVHPDRATTDWRLTIAAPAALAQQIIPQGSITIDGISLTVAKAHNSSSDGRIRFEIAIIPHTYRSTNLHTLAPGTSINIETDVLAKYAAAHQVTSQNEWLTSAYLLANGY